MIKIVFHPDSDQEDYSEIVGKYEQIWKDDGKRIINTIEKYSGLKFKEKTINAVAYFGSLSSRSRPLSLRANLPPEIRLGTLVHELCHRILAGNKVKIKFNDHENASFEVHKVLNLILYDIWTELYGKKFANKVKEWESNSRSGVYKKAWEWALSFDKTTRALKFKKLAKIK